jgi:hypothetical protein
VEPVAVIRKAGRRPLVEIRNVLEPGEKIEYMAAGIDATPVTVEALHNEKKELIQRANPGNLIYLTTSPALEFAVENGMLRREVGYSR